jgi:ATP-dependent DNA helicase DinG
MLEAEVHSELLAFLRQTARPSWVHHLTMARLVARGLRLGRSALIQTGVERQQYYLSYLMPALLSSTSVILVAPNSVKKQLLEVEIPQLQQCLNTDKLITTKPTWDEAHNRPTLSLISPQVWLGDRLNSLGNFPDGIPTLIDLAENLEDYAREYLTVTIEPQDWHDLQQQIPQDRELIRDCLIKLTFALFSHPDNPYQSYLLDGQERDIITDLCQILTPEYPLNNNWLNFLYYYQEKNQKLAAYLNKNTGKFTLFSYPLEVASKLKPIWQKQPVVLMGSYLEDDKNAPIYCDCLGIERENLTCVQFSLHPQNRLLQLYLPERFPLPNTPEFQPALTREILGLVGVTRKDHRPIVIIIGDIPLQAQVTASLAAQFGSRVELETQNLTNDSILVCGWQFWQKYQTQLPSPQLLIIATLPIPSLENPLVAARVAYYKSQRQDWFRLFLLPTAIKEMQKAVMSSRNSQGLVALLDNRVNFRSYGSKILAALEPFAKINYLDLSWFC